MDNYNYNVCPGNSPLIVSSSTNKFADVKQEQKQKQKPVQKQKQEQKQKTKISHVTNENSKKRKHFNVSQQQSLNPDPQLMPLSLIKWSHNSCFIDSLVMLILFSTAAPFFTANILNFTPSQQQLQQINKDVDSQCPMKSNKKKKFTIEEIENIIKNIQIALNNIKIKMYQPKMVPNCSNLRQILAICDHNIFPSENFHDPCATYSVLGLFFPTLQNHVRFEYYYSDSNGRIYQKDNMKGFVEHVTVMQMSMLWHIDLSTREIAEALFENASTMAKSKQNPPIENCGQTMTNIISPMNDVIAFSVSNDKEVNMWKTHFRKYHHRLDIEQTEYELFAMMKLINHSHYYSYIKMINGEWYYFNAVPRKATELKSIQTNKLSFNMMKFDHKERPHILFYQKKIIT